MVCQTTLVFQESPRRGSDKITAEMGRAKYEVLREVETGSRQTYVANIYSIQYFRVRICDLNTSKGLSRMLGLMQSYNYILPLYYYVLPGYPCSIAHSGPVNYYNTNITTPQRWAPRN